MRALGEEGAEERFVFRVNRKRRRAVEEKEKKKEGKRKTDGDFHNGKYYNINRIAFR